MLAPKCQMKCDGRCGETQLVNGDTLDELLREAVAVAQQLKEALEPCTVPKCEYNHKEKP